MAARAGFTVMTLRQSNGSLIIIIFFDVKGIVHKASSW
jgi:hypothetical protein